MSVLLDINSYVMVINWIAVWFFKFYLYSKINTKQMTTCVSNLFWSAMWNSAPFQNNHFLHRFIWPQWRTRNFLSSFFPSLKHRILLKMIISSKAFLLISCIFIYTTRIKKVFRYFRACDTQRWQQFRSLVF